LGYGGISKEAQQSSLLMEQDHLMLMWEYHVVTVKNTLSAEELNHYGSFGWELVGFSSHVEKTRTLGDKTIILYVFKRPK
jgi:hypothetical protein